MITLSDDGEKQKGQFLELKKALASNERDYFYGKKEVFSKLVNKTISTYQKEIKKLEVFLSKMV